MAQDAPMAINSRNYSWSEAEIRFLDRSPVAIVAFSFTRRKRKDNIYGRGSEPIGRTRGNKEYEGSITLLQSEYEALEDLAQEQGVNDPLDLAPFPISVAWDNGSQISAYTLEYAEFLEIPMGMSQDDPNMEIELPVIIGRIRRAQ